MLKMNINIVLVMCLYIIRWFNYVPMRVKSENLFLIKVTSLKVVLTLHYNY